VQLAYAIGVVEPVSIYVETFGTSKVDNSSITDAIKNHFDLSSAGIIKKLDLKKPIFKKTATYGHF
jgi:S-adenosylmethionine synthetase